VITTVAFHAERSNGGAKGEFDCLAFAPEAQNGSHSGQLTVNAMYVVGKITGASVQQDTVTLTGVADITGLGVGTNVPFTFIAHRGGPGASAILTVGSLTFPFNEILGRANSKSPTRIRPIVEPAQRRCACASRVHRHNRDRCAREPWLGMFRRFIVDRGFSTP
jgi:hypothetical protein